MSRFTPAGATAFMAVAMCPAVIKFDSNFFSKHQNWTTSAHNPRSATMVFELQLCRETSFGRQNHRCLQTTRSNDEMNFRLLMNTEHFVTSSVAAHMAMKSFCYELNMRHSLSTFQHFILTPRKALSTKIIRLYSPQVGYLAELGIGRPLGKMLTPQLFLLHPM
jgi:hypothetical protein